LLLCISGISSSAQEVIRPQGTQVFHSDFIGFSLSELPFADFRLFYERKLNPSHGIIVTAGYKPAYKSFTDATQINLGQTSTSWCYRNTATWLYLAAGYRYYFNQNKTFYASPEIFYKYGWADKIVYTFGVGSGGNTLTNQYEIRSMTASIAGLNLLAGKKLRIKFSQGFHMGLDIYAGLTLRYKLLNTTIYGMETASRYHDETVNLISIPLSEDPDISKEDLFQFSGQFGINLFFSWL
jgi:hypothetical protein